MQKTLIYTGVILRFNLTQINCTHFFQVQPLSLKVLIITALQLAKSVRGPSPLSRINLISAKRHFTFMVQHYKPLGFLSRRIPEVSSVLLQSKYL
jgi:hypothetical protein